MYIVRYHYIHYYLDKFINMDSKDSTKKQGISLRTLLLVHLLIFVIFVIFGYFVKLAPIVDLMPTILNDLMIYNLNV